MQDTGIGIPAHQLPRIFDRFFQVDSSITRPYDGTGIGLALVKELVELHHGVIDVKSTEGIGTTFTILLPLTVAHPEHHLRQPAADQLVVPNETTAREVKAEQAGRKAQVLIVEVNTDLRNFLVDCFTPAYRTLAADNRNEGLDQAMAHLPDLIISDVMIPGLNGIELCRRLKTHELTSHIPVVLLTAKTGSESRLAGLDTGADEYLTKPFGSGRCRARAGAKGRIESGYQTIDHRV